MSQKGNSKGVVANVCDDPKYINNSMLYPVKKILINNGTIGKFFLLEVFVHICAFQSLTDVMKFATDLSH